MDFSKVLGEDGFIDMSKVFSNHSPAIMPPEEDFSWVDDSIRQFSDDGNLYEPVLATGEEMGRYMARKRAETSTFGIAPEIMDADQNNT